MNPPPTSVLESSGTAGQLCAEWFGELKSRDDPVRALIRLIEDRIDRQVDAIRAHEEFRRMRRTWWSLAWLLRTALPQAEAVPLFVLDCSRNQERGRTENGALEEPPSAEEILSSALQVHGISAAALVAVQLDADSPTRELTLALASIDRRVRAQVDAILHHPTFQRLESTWSSLEYLVHQVQPTDQWRIRVLNATSNELLEDIEDAIEFDQSALFQKVYEEEFGRFGGEPYGVLVVDSVFGPEPVDLVLLRGLARVASAAHAPLLAAASAELLGMGGWRELSRHEPNGVGSAAFDSLRRSEDARYVALVGPRVLLRTPYTPGPPERWLGLSERAHDPSGKERLWGNPAFVLAERIVNAFKTTGWVTAFRGLAESRGVAAGLPREDFGTDAVGLVRRPPVEVALSEMQESAIAQVGIIPLCHVAGSSDVAFFSLPVLHSPAEFEDPGAQSNVRLSAQLPYVLVASRLAHYLKGILRNRIGNFIDSTQIQRELSAWLSQYTLDDPNAPMDRKARFPLRKFRVHIRPRPDRPGDLTAQVHVQPHYQIDDPNVLVRFSVDVPQPADPSQEEVP